jgi:hypothetical protein
LAYSNGCGTTTCAIGLHDLTGNFLLTAQNRRCRSILTINDCKLRRAVSVPVGRYRKQEFPAANRISSNRSTGYLK